MDIGEGVGIKYDNKLSLRGSGDTGEREVTLGTTGGYWRHAEGLSVLQGRSEIGYMEIRVREKKRI
jgi:hypothetical protein